MTTAIAVGVALAVSAVSQPRVPALASAASRGPAVTAARATDPLRATPVKHVVVLYMENHSFDSLLGFWCDSHPQRCPNGGMPSSVTLSDGAVVTPHASPDVVPNVNHETVDQVHAINGGAMNGWQLIKGCQAPKYGCISGYRPPQEPNLMALVRHFAISDMTFSMQDSPSWFGHTYAVAASTDGFTGHNPGINNGPGVGWGCDSGKTATWVSGGQHRRVPACVPDPSLIGPGGKPLANGGAWAPTPVPYVPTIMDRLTAAGLSWRIYGARCTDQTTNAQGLKLCMKANGAYVYSICPTFAECLYNQYNGLRPTTSFITDAASGHLSAFSVITPSDVAKSEHNGTSMTVGDNWLGKIVAAVMNGPEWGSTAMFITWDDCGCFYDQVPPGTNPDGTPQGPRVPLVIISPYAKSGYTDTTHTTFAGILAYTEHIFGLAPLSPNDAAAYPFTNAFNYAQAPLHGVRMVTRPMPKGDHILWWLARQDS
jgi:phospholipase C